MLHISKTIAAVLTLVLFVATAAFAGDSPSEINQRIGNGDPVAGKAKSALAFRLFPQNLPANTK